MPKVAESAQMALVNYLVRYIFWFDISDLLIQDCKLVRVGCLLLHSRRCCGEQQERSL